MGCTSAFTFEHKDRILVCERILSESLVCTASGVPSVFLRLAPKDLLVLLPTARVLPDFTQEPELVTDAAVNPTNDIAPPVTDAAAVAN